MKRSYYDAVLSVFPPPHFLTTPSVGIDVSDHSIKFIEFRTTPKGLEVGRFGEQSIPDGIVVSGKIQNAGALTEILASVRREHKLHFVRATLPEEGGYLFELTLPPMPDTEMGRAIEFRLEENVPIAPVDAVFGHDVLRGAPRRRGTMDEKQKYVVVSVFPKIIADMYAKLFYDAGLIPLSLETEPQATARSVVPHHDVSTHLIVDFGRERSGISIVSGGAVRFATTTNTGGDTITTIFQEQFSEYTPEQITNVKNTKGLSLIEEHKGMHLEERIISVLKGLVNDVQRHMQYWNSRSSEEKHSAHVSKVILCGGNANLAGLPEYLSQHLQLPVRRANVWANAFSLERYVPEDISFQQSLGYAPAIGLALEGIMRSKLY